MQHCDLYDLMSQVKKRDGPSQWTGETRTAFSHCKEALSATTHLAHPKVDAQLRLCTDTSNIAVGGVLEQF